MVQEDGSCFVYGGRVSAQTSAYYLQKHANWDTTSESEWLQDYISRGTWEAPFAV